MNKDILINLFFLPGLEKTQIKIFDENFWNAECSQGKKVLEIEKNNSKNSSENQIIFEFLKNNTVKLENISKIFFCSWPWRFMSMRISAIIANTFKNQNPEIQLFSIPTAEFLSKKSNWEKIFLQLNNSEIFTLINQEEKIYLREDLEEKFDSKNNSDKIFFYWNLKKWLFDFENFEEIDEKKLLSDEKILKKIFLEWEKFLTKQIKIFYWKPVI